MRKSKFLTSDATPMRFINFHYVSEKCRDVIFLPGEVYGRGRIPPFPPHYHWCMIKASLWSRATFSFSFVWPFFILHSHARPERTSVLESVIYIISYSKQRRYHLPIIIINHLYVHHVSYNYCNPLFISYSRNHNFVNTVEWLCSRHNVPISIDHLFSLQGYNRPSTWLYHGALYICCILQWC